MGPTPRDRTGQKIGRLTLIYFSHRGTGPKGPRYWVAECECGKRVIYRLGGNAMSCGCLLKERPSGTRTHGMRHTPTYESWAAMKQRCLNPNNPRYQEWGGRGITICQQWIDSFEQFLADMGERPSIKHTLDRHPDNDGNYEPGNVRWATAKEQANNRRSLRVSRTGRKLR